MITEQQARDFGAKLISEMMQEVARVGVDIFDITLTNSIKTNANNSLSITVKFNDSEEGPSVSPSLPVNRLYEEYKQGITMEELAKKTVQAVDIAHKQNSNFSIAQICKENASEKLFLVVINKNMNPEIAAKTPHIDIQGTDLMAVPRWSVSMSNGMEKGSILVKHEMLSAMLHMTPDEVLRIAKENMLRNETFSCKGMSEVLQELMQGQMSEGMVAEMLPPGPEQLYVLTNAEKMNGATVLLSKEALASAKEKMGENYFLICSSVHELIAVPRNCVADPAVLQEMNREVNETQLEEDEVLGNNILYYNGKLHVCNSLEELQKIDSLQEGVSESLTKGVRM